MLCTIEVYSPMGSARSGHRLGDAEDEREHVIRPEYGTLSSTTLDRTSSSSRETNPAINTDVKRKLQA